MTIATEAHTSTTGTAPERHTAAALMPTACSGCGKKTWTERPNEPTLCSACGAADAEDSDHLAPNSPDRLDDVPAAVEALLADAKPKRGRKAAAATADTRNPESSGSAPAETAESRLLEIPILSIGPSSRNPRREFQHAELQTLADSIRQVGVLQPIVVRPATDAMRTDPRTVDPIVPAWEIVAGERRWRAAALAGLARIPAIVREDLTDEDHLVLALVENLQRRDLNAVDEAEAFRTLAEHGLTQEEIGKRVGRSQPTVANALRLLDLPASVRRRIRQGELSATHGLALLRLKEDHDLLVDLATAAVGQQWSTDRLREEVDKHLAPALKAAKPEPFVSNDDPLAHLSPAGRQAVGEAFAAVSSAFAPFTQEEKRSIETTGSSAAAPPAPAESSTPEPQTFQAGDLVEIVQPAGDQKRGVPYVVVAARRHVWGHWLYELGQKDAPHIQAGTVLAAYIAPWVEPAAAAANEDLEPGVGQWWADMVWTGGSHRLDVHLDGGEWEARCGARFRPWYHNASENRRRCHSCTVASAPERFPAPLIDDGASEHPAQALGVAPEHPAQPGRSRYVLQVILRLEVSSDLDLDPLCQDVQERCEATSYGADVTDFSVDVEAIRACRACGCTDDAGCDEGCWWVGEDLCSSCETEASDSAPAAEAPEQEPAADEPIGVDAKGRPWRIWSRVAVASGLEYFGLSYTDAKGQEHSEQFAPTYDSREAAIAKFREAWEAQPETADPIAVAVGEQAARMERIAAFVDRCLEYGSGVAWIRDALAAPPHDAATIARVEIITGVNRWKARHPGYRQYHPSKNGLPPDDWDGKAEPLPGDVRRWWDTLRGDQREDLLRPYFRRSGRNGDAWATLPQNQRDQVKTLYAERQR